MVKTDRKKEQKRDPWKDHLFTPCKDIFTAGTNYTIIELQKSRMYTVSL